ncbi:Deoxyguanosinetriphosphate triphosphohydrolase [Candidatus Ornithobacterium hominis]|uniref:Deoxyguanosinetriphosphate triphosphohydrolase n=1 Tax=Candidatus Ornithobacterium hominis TaxID=2497989 RepID=A0A383U188_9FLAO|nr:dNTP triphosphohydrolase [Candidatus Ornithobacterium hominis]MCT7904258.1 dNTP triphosphohydrolase [Candidatus Ornithobacterium hominis]SZD72921.1 Deoxyguanosinetriphosphate triphosphohydrolase [Candidatus Ornithobacterium hominis]
MTDLNRLYSDQRTWATGQGANQDYRTAFQRDYDRIIFSPAFRKLQNKTQVFPLPGTTFVHNRLTHSLEVASVGRSLGHLVGHFFASRYKSELSKESRYFYRHNLAYVISSAALCHDIGNPAFGHSGEDAVAQYFVENEGLIRPLVSEAEWQDLTQFEGNANAIRVLTHAQSGKSKGGMLLTYSTLSAIAKYPCESSAKDKNFLRLRKFGFFQAEKEIFVRMAEQTGMKKIQDSPVSFARHPFVWLTEAADDICYNIIDFEDAHRLQIIDHGTCLELLKNIVVELGEVQPEEIERKLSVVTDKNDAIAYLRAKAISVLTQLVYERYVIHHEKLLAGEFETSLFDLILNKSVALQQIRDFSFEHIYRHKSVMEIELAGYRVMGTLLSYFVPAVIKEKNQRTKEESLTLSLLPEPHRYEGKDVYHQILGVIDFITMMTDDEALEFYRKMTGIQIGINL